MFKTTKKKLYSKIWELESKITELDTKIKAYEDGFLFAVKDMNMNARSYLDEITQHVKKED